MYTLNTTRAIKKITVNEIRGFILENYNKRIEISKESSYYSMKLLKRIDLLLLADKSVEKEPDPCNGQ